MPDEDLTVRQMLHELSAENARLLAQLEERDKEREETANPRLLTKEELDALTPPKIIDLDERQPGLIERSYAALNGVK